MSQTLAPGDYGIPVVFQAGTFTTTEFTATVSVLINDDTILENEEIFLGRLRYTGMGNVEITQDEATVTILDNDGRLPFSAIYSFLLVSIVFLCNELRLCICSVFCYSLLIITSYIRSHTYVTHTYALVLCMRSDMTVLN